MLFTEPTFLFLFLPILLLLYFVPLTRVHGRYGNWLLLAASVIFYAKGGGAFTWLSVVVLRTESPKAAIRLFTFSITYVTLLFGAMLGSRHGLDAVPAEWLSGLRAAKLVIDNADDLAMMVYDVQRGILPPWEKDRLH